MSSPAKATGNPLKSTMKKSKGNAKSKTKTTSHKSKVKVKPRRMSAMTLVEQARQLGLHPANFEAKAKSVTTVASNDNN